MGSTPIGVSSFPGWLLWSMLIRGTSLGREFITMTQPWDLPEREATPEKIVLSRRRWLKMLVGGTIGGVAAGGACWWLNVGQDDQTVLARGRYDAPEVSFDNPSIRPEFANAGRLLTVEPDAARYTNFYEFSSFKWVWSQVDSFQPLPWTLEVGGLVRCPRTYDVDDLFRAFPLEQRVYRHRCVEAWAMTVPWFGFPLAALLRKAEPLAGAKYVRFVSFDRPTEVSRQRDHGMPWPYTEGLTLAEATNELAFIATGMYGHRLLKQHGAPVRLVVPWKYGFKSAKSITRIELTDQQPRTFWNTLVPHEYGFQANVEPAVPHPRWSQSSERLLGSGERVQSRYLNGYSEWVGKLYKA
jgi:methionine sulfoxide reductase catalytic subunit